MYKRVSWTIIDQGITSVTTFTVSIVAATLTTSTQFGLFSTYLAAYLLCQIVFRAALIEPIVVKYTESGDAQQEGLRRARGCAILGAVVTTALCGIVGTAMGSPVSMATLGVSVAALLLSDFTRFAFITEGKPQYAALTALLCLCATGAILGILITTSAANSLTVFGSWGGAAFVAAMVTNWSRQTAVTFRGLATWLREHRRAMAGHLVDSLLSSGSRQVATLLVAAVGGLPAAAAIRGAQLAMGPFTVLDLVLGTLVLSEGSRVRRTAPEKLVRFVFAASVILSVGALAFGAAISYMSPSMGHSVLGHTWYSARDVVGPMAMLVAANALLLGASTGLRVVGMSDVSARYRLVSVPIVLGAAVAGVTAGGARGAVIAQAIVIGVAAIAWWRAFIQYSPSLRVAAVPEFSI